MKDPMAVDPVRGDICEEDTREAPWSVTEFFLDPRRYNPRAEILHKAANVSLTELMMHIPTRPPSGVRDEHSTDSTTLDRRPMLLLQYVTAALAHDEAFRYSTSSRFVGSAKRR